MGRTVSPEEFTGICLALQARGAENINLVTGSHAVPALVEGIALARSRGLSLPVLWNSSAYERPGTLELLRDTIDSYLPDLKTLDRDLAARLFNAPDYPETAVAAIIKMIENLEGRAALCGAPGSFLIIRHLALPGRLEASREVLRWFAGHAQGRLRGRAALSVMTQYTPPGVAEGGPCQAPNRFLREDEYLRLLGWLEDFGIDQGYCQELAGGPDSGPAWLPDFSRVNPFSSVLSTPIWHWKTGFGEDTSATLR
jgi:putative pyruvate formate lyase activating enzyme